MEEELYMSEIRTMVKTAEDIISESTLLSAKGKQQVRDSHTGALLSEALG